MHWLTPVGSVALTGWRWAPWVWVAFTLVLLVHEAGHAVIARRAGARVLSIDLLPLGGACRWTGDVTPIAHACIAWGGVWAQMLLYVAATCVETLLGPAETVAAAAVLSVFTHANLWMMGLNLLPIPPLDGAKAWRLPALLPVYFEKRRVLRARGSATQSEDARWDAVDRSMQADEVPAQVKTLVADFLDDLKRR